MFAVVNIAGVVAFALPFLMEATPSQQEAAARSGDAPWLLALLAPLLIAVALTEAARRRLDAKSIALLGVLAALAALMRIPLSLGGANLMFLLPILGGFVFGVRFGFLLGALAMAASAAITGGIGPWLPFQMWGAGWVGAGAGLLRPLTKRAIGKPATVIILALYGYVAGLFFGAVLNIYFWPVTSLPTEIGWSPDLSFVETLEKYRSFYLLTSLPYDAFRGIGNALLILLVGRPVVDLLRRHQRRFSFEVEWVDASPRGFSARPTFSIDSRAQPAPPPREP
jgi:energy-coupling factor transport system substrate-specific component